MKDVIEINGKSMAFEATAMTDHMVDHIFLIRKIAFVMNKRAELGGWRQVEELSPEDFYDWLDQLDSYELEGKAGEIMKLYARNKKTSVSPKNTTSPQAE